MDPGRYGRAPDRGERAEFKKFPTPDPQPGAQLRGQIGYLVDLAKANFVANSDRTITPRNWSRAATRSTRPSTRTRSTRWRSHQEGPEEEPRPGEARQGQVRAVGRGIGGAGDGAILAVYGGEDATKHFNNNADYTGAAVGSTFKPFVMAAAMRDGKRDPESRRTSPTSARRSPPRAPTTGTAKIKDYNGKTWLNKDNEEWHQENEGRDGTDTSTCTRPWRSRPTLRSSSWAWTSAPDRVQKAAMDAGIDDAWPGRLPPSRWARPLPARSGWPRLRDFRHQRLAGRPLFGDQGRARGGVVYVHEKETEPAFVRGRGQRHPYAAAGDQARHRRDGQLPGRPAAGKTGTTDENRTAWFAGYTPQLSTTIGMWRVDDL